LSGHTTKFVPVPSWTNFRYNGCVSVELHQNSNKVVVYDVKSKVWKFDMSQSTIVSTELDKLFVTSYSSPYTGRIS